MNMEQLKQAIQGFIEQISSLKLENLYPENPNVSAWQGAMTIEEIKKFVEEVLSVLRGLKDNMNLLDGIGYSYANNIYDNLNNFITHFDAIKNLQADQITSQHHNSLNILQSLNTTLRNSGLYTQIKFLPDIDERTKNFKEAEKLAKVLVKQKADFEGAIKIAKDFLDAKDSVQNKILKEHANTFVARANEHKISIEEKISWQNWNKGKGIWFVGALVAGVIVAIIIWGFIDATKNNITLSVGTALLRISSLIVPSYFMIFCAQQYLYHQRMYEIYCFKDTALHTMTELTTTTSKEEVKERIIEKGLEVIFTEPSLKEDGKKYDKQIITELISMLRQQIDNK